MHDKDSDIARQMVSSLRNNNCNNHKIKKNAFKGHNQFPSALGILPPGMGSPPLKMFPVMDFVNSVGPSHELQGNKPNCCRDVLMNQLFYKSVKLLLIAESYKSDKEGAQQVLSRFMCISG